MLSSEHMAALISVAMKATSAMHEVSPDDAEIPRSMAFKMEAVEFMTECFKEAQRTMTKRFEAELSALVSRKAELMSEMAEAAAPKPPAVSNAKLDAGIVAVKGTTAVPYAVVFVGGISKTVTDVQLQEVFRTKALVGRFYRKGSAGFAKVLVPLDQLHQALGQDTIFHGRKCRVAKWGASPRAHGHQAVRGRSLMKERARFMAELLTAAQNPGVGLRNSPRGQRLYSQDMR